MTVEEVDRYRDHKRREGALGAESINETLTRLGQIMERAEEYELVSRNPMRVGKRKLKTSKATRSYLDDAAQVADLLAAADELDAEARHAGRHIPRRALIAVLAFTGLRIGEALALAGATSISPAAGSASKGQRPTPGVRYVTVQPALRGTSSPSSRAPRTPSVSCSPRAPGGRSGTTTSETACSSRSSRGQASGARRA